MIFEDKQGSAASAVLDRSEVDPKQTWDVEAIFSTDEAWEDAFRMIDEQIPALADYQGRLGESAAVFLEAQKAVERVSIEFGKLYVYAHLKHDENTANPTYMALQSRAMALGAKFGATVSWMEPEMAELSDETLDAYLASGEELGVYAHMIDDLRRNRAHILSDKEEKLLAQLSPVIGASSDTFGILNNADLSFPEIEDEDGNTVEITHSRYGKMMESKDRRVRREAFQKLYSVYDQYKNTLATTLSGSTKGHNITAAIRGFGSAREQALFSNAIPEAVHENLIQVVNENLSLLHRYVDLRKRILGVDELHSYDLYVSLLPDVDMNVSIEEAEEIALAALAPLGEEYVSIVQKAFDDRWIDFAENRGKRSGAYSSGTYGTLPYILMNWQGTLDNLFTLVHELGHSVHSYYSRSMQPYIYSGYSIFLAEIASTLNENLLTEYLLRTKTDPKLGAFVMNHYLDGFKGTVFRQTQFAEFEHQIHLDDQNGVALTADYMSKYYGEMNQRYYGAGLTADSEIALEWSRIPHFYYNYYVYQYSTGFSAATAFFQAIMSEGQPAVDRYLGFLKSGSSAYPLDVLRTAGLDMSTPEPVRSAMQVFERYLNELEDVL